MDSIDNAARLINLDFQGNIHETPFSASVNTQAAGNEGEIYSPQLMMPQANIAPAALTIAQEKMHDPTFSLTLSAERQQTNSDKLETAHNNANTPAGADKAKSYKALTKSLLHLTAALVSTTLVAVTTVATHGVTTPLLAVSTLVLINAIVDTAFATINVLRARKDLPPLKIENIVQQGVAYTLRKIHIPENIITKLDADVFRRIGIAYKMSLSITQFAMSFVILAPPPEIVGILSKTFPLLIKVANIGVETFMANSDKKATEKISASEANLLNTEFNTKNAKKIILLLAVATISVVSGVASVAAGTLGVVDIAGRLPEEFSELVEGVAIASEITMLAKEAVEIIQEEFESSAEFEVIHAAPPLDYA